VKNWELTLTNYSIKKALVPVNPISMTSSMFGPTLAYLLVTIDGFEGFADGLASQDADLSALGRDDSSPPLVHYQREYAQFDSLQNREEDPPEEFTITVTLTGSTLLPETPMALTCYTQRGQSDLFSTGRELTFAGTETEGEIRASVVLTFPVPPQLQLHPHLLTNGGAHADAIRQYCTLALEFQPEEEHHPTITVQVKPLSIPKPVSRSFTPIPHAVPAQAFRMHLSNKPRPTTRYRSFEVDLQDLVYPVNARVVRKVVVQSVSNHFTFTSSSPDALAAARCNLNGIAVIVTVAPTSLLLDFATSSFSAITLDVHDNLVVVCPEVFVVGEMNSAPQPGLFPQIWAVEVHRMGDSSDVHYDQEYIKVSDPDVAPDPDPGPDPDPDPDPGPKPKPDGDDDAGTTSSKSILIICMAVLGGILCLVLMIALGKWALDQHNKKRGKRRNNSIALREGFLPASAAINTAPSADIISTGTVFDWLDDDGPKEYLPPTYDSLDTEAESDESD
jgi:hypothetical protein